MARGRKSMGASKERKISVTFTLGQLEDIAEAMSTHPAGERAETIISLLKVNHPEWF